MYFKFFIYLIAAANLLTGEEGWAPVDKVPAAEELVTDVDPSIWVLFAKQVGGELWTARFPVDPILEADGFVARASQNGEVFEVAVLPKTGSFTADSLFEWEGQWIHEHNIQTEEHLFRLRTYSPNSASLKHAIFTSSFSISS